MHAGEGVGHRQARGRRGSAPRARRRAGPARARRGRVRKAGVLLGHRVADGVGDVDRRRALVDARSGRTSAVKSRSARVASIGRELDVVAVALGLGHRGAGQALDVLARGLQLVHDVDVRRRDEGVDARALGVAHRLPRALDVGRVGAGQAGDDRSMDLAGDRLHGLEVAGRGDREAGLDDVDAQARELVGDLELLGRVERDARRLLAVAQRRVEDQYSVGAFRWHVVLSMGFVLRLLVIGLRLRGRHALFPPKGEEEKSKGELERHASYQPSPGPTPWQRRSPPAAPRGRSAARPPTCAGRSADRRTSRRPSARSRAAGRRSR